MTEEKSSQTLRFVCVCTISQFNPESIFGDQTEVTTEEFDKLDNPDLITYEDNRVLPSELDQKLRLLLLEQQESQIAELESELQQSHSELNDKELELQTLKDCIRHLTEVSIGSVQPNL